jgi:hypothetical protein
MNLKKITLCAVLALLANLNFAYAETSKSIELFGVSLKNTTRDQLRTVLKSNGLQAVREDKQYWVDTYNASGVLEGASEFLIGYVSATDKFAYAQYKFPAFMNEQMVAKVINMVATKYGKPSSMSGNISLGPVTAKWQMSQAMSIEVSRGWPDTTTYLKFIDLSAYKVLQAESEADRNAQAAQKAKSQNNAF